MPSLPSKIKTFPISIKSLKLKLYKEAVIKDFFPSPILQGFFTLFQVFGCLRKNSHRRGGEEAFETMEFARVLKKEYVEIS